MVISEDNIFVRLKYRLYVGADGEEVMIEETPEDEPFRFTTGLKMVLPKFESTLYGKDEGDKFDFILSSDDAYGDYFEDLCVELSKELFKNEEGVIDEKVLFVGNVLPMMNDAGQRMNGRVCDVSEDKVKMDFNHPYAGERLHFVGEIVEARPATEFEIDIVKGHRGCGGCGGCGGGCHSDCGNEGGCGGDCKHGDGGCGGNCKHNN